MSRALIRRLRASNSCIECGRLFWISVPTRLIKDALVELTDCTNL